MDPSRKVPTIADLEGLPVGVKGEIIEGVLSAMNDARIEPFDAIALDIGSWW